MKMLTSSGLWGLKILFIAAGTVSLAMAMKASWPVLMHDLPTTVRTGFTACLRPPYLYAIINGIILTLLCASRFQQESLEDHQKTSTQPGHQFRPFLPRPSPEVVPVKTALSKDGHPLMHSAALSSEEEFIKKGNDHHPTFVKEHISRSHSTESRRSSPELLSAAAGEPPLPDHNPASEPHASLEDTWRMIAERSNVPPTPQLKRQQLKSKTFKERSNYGEPPKGCSAAAAKMRREPWLSQDELNRRVEAFIEKFNEEMRLQRQRSLQQHMEMIRRGAR
ncbi:unnamed protein product [Cuscuta epithymum]|uniref:DUF4408 domain-containing protein n=1 Tax=Cuscuta epithymum TaxID=186058 RepID=A0AAV0D5T1_9ASTE|nr:unnamed protein product [Cuscuta epithymum]